MQTMIPDNKLVIKRAEANTIYQNTTPLVYYPVDWRAGIKRVHALNVVIRTLMFEPCSPKLDRAGGW